MADYDVRDNDLLTDDVNEVDDGIQHGIDDNPNNDAAKGAAIGGVGGAVVGAAAGAMLGPLGAIGGAIAGGVAGAAASGAAVAAVDSVDNDDNVTGLGDDVRAEGDTTRGAPTTDDMATSTAYDTTPGTYSTGGLTGTAPLDRTDPMYDDTIDDDPALAGNDVPGVQTGGRTLSGAPDTRGVMEKTADAVTGDRVDDKTGDIVR